MRAKKANGAGVRLFRILDNQRELIANGRLNGAGVFATVVDDENGQDITAYKAVVFPTRDTLRGATSRFQQR